MIYLDNASTTKPSQTALQRALVFANEQFYNPSTLYREGYSIQGEIKKSRSVLLSKLQTKARLNLFSLPVEVNQIIKQSSHLQSVETLSLRLGNIQQFKCRMRN